MTTECQNCKGSVWFDETTKRWKHGKKSNAGTDGCRKPWPYFVGTKERK